ncbi:putative ER to Golgi transport-related protein [Kockovaella imperatae]|uniref:Putative ER to Golgi transport-related protein n=1 Tax=Kockovaella imperatae TaxID=4999 RepID=A0A1Y1U656_9TREE|nr:putative ER to Golgi transport-related protein [Kockovaella imperatae]ORX33521.1 putative ER to Golgi transport-related protein [Kockovaella imperatae]
MRLHPTLALLAVLNVASALHFYFESHEKRCFLEELPSDTIVEGHYRALVWNEERKEWGGKEGMGIQVEVQELASGHNVVNTRGPPEGKFTFTSHDSGDHEICLHSNVSSGSWIGGSEHIKMYLDINVGSSKKDMSDDVSHVTTLATKIRDLNTKVKEIQLEQKYMREVEATFRDASEKTNSRAVWWSIIQIVVLVGAAFGQMRYLRTYFEDKKLR